MDKALTEQYRLEVAGIITERLRVVMLTGTFLYLAFSLLDAVLYPAYLMPFLKIRLAVSACLLAMWRASYLGFVQRRVRGFVQGIMMVAALGICLMIYASDGSHSDYYEGLNLVVLAFLVTNSFSASQLAIFGAGVLGLYTVAAVGRDGLADSANYISACFFITSTVLFSCLIAWLYSVQYRKQFIATNALRESEAKLAAAYQTAKTEAQTDDLTGLYNRRAFFNLLQQKIAQGRMERRNFWLVIADADNLKTINDRFGHLAGDEAIRALARTLERQLRRGTTIARYGGDEFMMILDEAPADRLLKRLEAIRDAVCANTLRHGQATLPLSASFGAVEFRHDAEGDRQELLERADRALLEAKSRKRGEIRLADT